MEPKVTQGGQDDKVRLREAARRSLTSLDAETRGSENLWLNTKLKDWVPGRGFETVLATLPMGDEPDLTPFLNFWLGHGRVALAKTGAGQTLTFHFINDLDGPWEAKRGGLREPRVEAPWTPGPRTLCLVPGVAFARVEDRITRLGRGGGYYDRWLSTHASEVFTLGVGFSVQAVGALPVQEHDKTLDGWLIPGL